MVFGMINIWQGVRVARGEIYHAHFSFLSFIKIPTIQPAWLLVYSQILFSCTTINLVCVCVCVIALEAKF